MEPRKRVSIECTCPACSGRGTVRSPESVAIEHARAIGTAYRPAGEWQDWVICPRCNDTGWIGGVHEEWTADDAWRGVPAVRERGGRGVKDRDAHCGHVVRAGPAGAAAAAQAVVPVPDVSARLAAGDPRRGDGGA